MVSQYGLPTDFPWGHAATPKTLPLALWKFSLVTERMWGVISEAAGYRSGMAVSGLAGVFGVASGLAEYFGVPPIVVRAAFVIATFLSILGLVAYFILAVWMPKPHATD